MSTFLTLVTQAAGLLVIAACVVVVTVGIREMLKADL